MELHNDKFIKLDYNPVLNAEIEYQNAVGATDSVTLRTLDFEPSDSTTIYVSKSGNDSTGTGTSALPVLTIKKASTLLTATKTNILITDDGVYEEESLVFSTNCKNICSAIGKKPRIKSVSTSSTNYILDTTKAPTVLPAVAGQSYRKQMCAALSNGNFVITYNVGSTTAAANLSYFQIINSSGTVIKTETAVGNNQPYVTALVGYFVIAFRNTNNNKLTIYVYNNSGGLIYSEAYIDCGYHVKGVGAVGLHNDRFVVVWNTGNDTYYFTVKGVDGTTYVTTKTLTSAGVEYPRIIPRKQGGFIFSYVAGNGMQSRFAVVNDIGTVLHDSVVISGVRNCSAAYNYGSDNLITFICSNPTEVYLIEYELTNYTVSKSSVLLDNSLTNNTVVHIDSTEDGNFITTFGYTSVIYKVVSKNWSVLATQTFATSRESFCAYNKYSNRAFISVVAGASPYAITYTVKSGFIAEDWWKFTADISLNGLTLDALTTKYVNYISTSGANFNVRWCTFQNINNKDYNDRLNYPLRTLKSTSTDNFISNTQVFNCDSGFHITSNSALVQRSQFYKVLLSPAIHLVGAGIYLMINHNDFLYNNTAIKLEGNNGSEVIKNSILFNSLVNSIYAQTAVTYSNSVDTASSFNANTGSQVVRSNPHYINDGFVSFASLNLALRIREIGFKFDSPAIGIADDLGNAGSLTYTLSNGTQTWTTITVAKPSIRKSYDSVGKIETSYKDGSVAAYRDSFTEVLVLRWKSILKSDFDELIAMYFTKSNVVKVYLDPVTNPLVHNTYTLTYNKINADASHWSFDNIGKEDFSLTLKRAYNEGI